MTSRQSRLTGDTIIRHLKANYDVLFLLLIGIVVRVWAFGDLPPGLNQDEAATGYDAWSVLNFGIDRNGFPFPVMFVSWGSGMYALNGYLAWPFMLLFGLSETSIRLPHLTLGIASLVLMYQLVRRIVDRPTAVTALLLLAINPWHIMISRWGLDSNILPGMFLIAVFLLILSLQKSRYLPWSAFVLGLCLYLYGTAYVVVPIFTVLAAITLKIFWKARWSSLGISAIVALVTGLPIALYVAINQFKWESIVLPFMSIPRLTGTPRFQTVSSVFSGDWGSIINNLREFWRLLLYQHDGLIWNGIEGYGQLYLIGLPFVIIGIVVACIRVWNARGKDPVIFLLFWLISAVTLAALQSVNVNRINVIYIALIFFCALGVQTIAWGNRFARDGILSVFLVLFSFFSHSYFTQYRAEASDDFFTGLGPAITHVTNSTNGDLCITDRVNMPYVFALFYDKTDPRQFNETVVYENPGAEFQWANQFGRFTFGLHRCNDRSYGGYVIHLDELDGFTDGRYDIRVFDHYASAIPF